MAKLITWSDLPGVPPVLREFAAAPAGFVVGVLLNVLVAGLETVVIAFVDAVVFVYEGDTVGSTEGMLGVADIPRVAANSLGAAGRAGGSALIDALEVVFEIVESGAEAAGPLAPIVTALAVGLAVLAVAYVLRVVWTLLVDSINPL